MSVQCETFFAGCVGTLVSVVLFGGINSANWPPRIGTAWRLLLAAGLVLLGGYVAVFVLEVEQPKHAFLVGLGLDGALLAMRKGALRIVAERDCDESPTQREITNDATTP